MGVMANPFYLDQGYSKAEIASIAKGLGFGMSIFGAFLGGLLVVRFGVLKTMLGGASLGRGNQPHVRVFSGTAGGSPFAGDCY